MKAVADASPLNYLIWIRCDHTLARLYGRVLVPSVVLRELRNPNAPEAVRAWLQRMPEWIVEREVDTVSDPALDDLDPGERHAIHLAETENANLSLMDERAGVRLTRKRGLLVTGTLGVLLQAAIRRLIDIDPALRDLEATAFRHTPDLMAEVRRRARQRSQ